MPRPALPALVAVGLALSLPLGCKPGTAPEPPRRDPQEAAATTKVPVATASSGGAPSLGAPKTTAAASAPAFTEADVPGNDDDLPCERAFPTPEALCACVSAVLHKQEQAEVTQPASCPSVRDLGADGKLAAIELTAGLMRERYIADLRPGQARLLRRIGRSTAGNARFGLGTKGFMESPLGTTEQRPTDKPPLVVQRWTQTTAMPTEMANLAEIQAWETRTESWVAYCVPPSAQVPEPRCNVNALVELVVEQSGQLPGQKPFSKKTITKTKTTIKDGDITLTVVKGKAADLPNDSVGTFQL